MSSERLLYEISLSAFIRSGQDPENTRPVFNQARLVQPEAILAAGTARSAAERLASNCAATSGCKNYLFGYIFRTGTDTVTITVPWRCGLSS